VAAASILVTAEWLSGPNLAISTRITPSSASRVLHEHSMDAAASSVPLKSWIKSSMSYLTKAGQCSKTFAY
jgi:hypothetical protein